MRKFYNLIFIRKAVYGNKHQMAWSGFHNLLFVEGKEENEGFTLGASHS